MRRALLVVLLCVMPCVASAERVLKKIEWKGIQPGVADTSAAYTLPTGASELWMQFGGMIAKYDLTVQFRFGEYPWMNYMARSEDLVPQGATWDAARASIDDTRRVHVPEFPPGSQYRFIVENTSDQYVGDFRVQFGYMEPDETR